MTSKSEFDKEFEPITSQQMYAIENIGEKRYRMNKILMMENAGSRIWILLHRVNFAKLI